MAALVIILGLGAVLLIAAAGWRWGGNDWDRHFAVAESLLAIGGLCGAGAWYFIARPDAPKLKLEQSVLAHAVGPNRVLLLDELSLTNVGGGSLRLKGETHKIFVQQITPLETKIAAEFQAENSKEIPRPLHPADTWNYLARSQHPVDTNVESGETENLYYRVIIPCSNDLSVYVTSWVYRPQNFLEEAMGRERLVWVKQTYIDLSHHCKNNEKRSNK